VQIKQLYPEAMLGLAIFVVALGIGILGTILGGSAKIRMWSWCSTLIGVSVCVFGVADLILQWKLPMVEVSGVIQKVGIQSTGRGSELTNLVVLLPSGQTLKLSASGRNEYFRPGERMEARYQTETGMIDWARFYTASGSEEASYRSYLWIVPYCLIGLGFLLIRSARKKRMPGRTQSAQPA
jgi:hypothetical protein